MLTERQKEYLGTLLTEGDFEFAHNLVKVVVDVVRERLSVDGLTVNGQDAGDETDSDPAAATAALLWQWWNDWRMDSQQIRLYRRTLRDGKSYVMVDYDAENGRPRCSLHEVDDYTTGITFHRDPEDANRVLFASRYFYTFDPLRPGATGSERKTVYLPGEIRKYVRDTNAVGTWRAILDDGDTAWPIPWTGPHGQTAGHCGGRISRPRPGFSRRHHRPAKCAQQIVARPAGRGRYGGLPCIGRGVQKRQNGTGRGRG